MRSRSLPRGVALGLVTLGTVAGFGNGPTDMTEPANADRDLGSIDIGAHAERPSPAPAAPGRVSTGNPLWAIPLRKLAATRERPIFSPSRRPPPPAVTVQPPSVLPAAPKPAEPDRPQLVLIGTIVGATEGFGIFLDQTTNNVIRLKLGEGLRGWVLRHTGRRQVTLEKDETVTVLTLPVPRGDDR